MSYATPLSLDEIAAIRWDKIFAHLGEGPISAEPYCSDEYFEAEKGVFCRTWLNVARVEELPNPGDYLVVNLEFLRQSIILTRGNDGELHAMHNVCSHRANRMISGGTGCQKLLFCKFHGWTYNIDGSLRYIPDEESFEPLDHEALALTPVHVDHWQGFVFINLAKQPSQTLHEFLKPLVTDLEGYPFNEVSKCSYWWTAEVPANWKLVRDAFLETYHVRFVHARSLPRGAWGNSNPWAHSLDFQLRGPHSRYAVPRNPEFRPTFMANKSFIHSGGLLDFELPPGVNCSRSEYWLQDVNVVFPNFLFAPSQGQLFGSYYSYNFWPVTKDRTRFVLKSYFPEPTSAAQRAAQEYGKVLLRDTVLEDFSLIAGQHLAVSSGVKTEFYLNATEVLIRHAEVVMNNAIKEVADHA
jgi:phenylpropionate dioxygenase-like ring-hydroxylating dioxygenase large terminal subunit